MRFVMVHAQPGLVLLAAGGRPVLVVTVTSRTTRCRLSAPSATRRSCSTWVRSPSLGPDHLRACPHNQSPLRLRSRGHSRFMCRSFE
jgi:hypothetical protein